MSMRGASSALISFSVTGFDFALASPVSEGRVAGSLRTISSTKVFHCPHEGHLPCHLGDSCPQLLHTYTVFSFAISLYFCAKVTINIGRFRAFLYFYRKKVEESDRLNTFIITFATSYQPR